MVSRIGALQFLRDEQARSLVDARARPLLHAIGGMTRFLYELIAGESAVSGEDPCVGINPQGLIGVDLSGPPWGPALLHPIGSWAGIATDVDVVEPDAEMNVTVVSSVPGYRRTGPWPIWVRPFESIEGVDVPYSRGLFALRAHQNGGSTDVVVRARNVTMGQSFAAARSTTLSVTSTSETSFAPAATFYVDLRPGLNFIDVDFFAAANAAVIDSVTVYQAVKLGH